MRYVHFILVFCSFQLSAQQVIQWQKCYGGTDFDACYSIQPTNDSGYVFVGVTLSSNGDIPSNHGGNDVWVGKLNANGVLQWSKTYGGSNNDRPYDIQQTTDGGYIIAGSTESNDGQVNGNHGLQDFWVFKINNTGQLQWQKCLGGSSYDIAFSARQTQDGGYVIAGQSSSTDGDVTKNQGLDDYWVVKLTASGMIEWQNSIGGSFYDDCYSIDLTDDGGYILAGASSSEDGDITGSHGSDDFWVVKLDANGSMVWQKAFGGSGLDRANSIRQTSDKGFIVFGETSSSDGDVTIYHGQYDCWIIRLDQTGNLIWQKSLGGSEKERGQSVCELDNGSFVTTGFTQSTDGDVVGNDGGRDWWVTSISSSGALSWQMTLGGTSPDLSQYINKSKDGGVIIAGQTESNNGDVSGNHGGNDVWIVKLSPTNTPTLTPTLTQLPLYPNPTNQQIALQIPDNEPITSIQITDLSGKVLKPEQATQDNTFQVAMLPKGMYLLKATSDSGQVFCGKFIKE